MAVADDFDPKHLVKVQDHEKLTGRVDKIEKKLGEGFVEFFCNASRDSTKIQNVFSEKIVGLLKDDVKTRDAVKKLIDDTDHRLFKAILRKGGMWVFGMVTFVSGVTITIIIQNFLKKP